MTGSVMRVVRRALLLLTPALVLIVLVPAGSAKPPTAVRNFEVCIQNATTLAPPCSSFGAHSSFAGGTHAASAQISIVNDGTSTNNIGSANITAPAQIRPETTGLPANVTVVGQVIQVRNVTIRPGRSLVFTVPVDTACSGSSLAWSSAADTSSGFTNTGGFLYQSGASAGDTSDLVTGCHVGFVNQPTDTQTGNNITDQGASGGNAIQVGLFNNDNTAKTTCPYGNGNCSVTLDRTPADGAPGGIWNQPLSADGSALVATFSGVSLTVGTSSLPEQFELTATGDSSLAPTVNSSPFLITLYAQDCTLTGNTCSLTQKKLPGNGNADSFADVTTAAGFTFTTLSPFSVGTTVPDGCANFKSLGVQGFAETDGRTPGGVLTVTYYVNTNSIKAKYGKNVGQQLIPICAGAKPVDPITHVARDCTVGDAPWTGDALGADGSFTGTTTPAICGADGYFWGILSSFQDKVDPSTSPTVTGWGSGNVGGAGNFRHFTIEIPPDWDFRGNG